MLLIRSALKVRKVRNDRHYYCRPKCWKSHERKVPFSTYILA